MVLIDNPGLTAAQSSSRDAADCEDVTLPPLALRHGGGHAPAARSEEFPVGRQLIRMLDDDWAIRRLAPPPMVMSNTASSRMSTSVSAPKSRS